MNGYIEADFVTMKANYPRYKSLPDHIASYMRSLNANLPTGGKRNTPCCIQVSNALNACEGHEIPSENGRRPRRNAEIPRGSGNYYIQAVDELEYHLTSVYGEGEGIKTREMNSAQQMKSHLAGRQGILVFREGYAGAHTEIWDNITILQSSGAEGSDGSVMNEQWMWGRPKILFWEVISRRHPRSHLLEPRI